MRTLLTLCCLAAAIAVSAQNQFNATMPKPKTGKTEIPKPVTDSVLRGLSKKISIGGISTGFADTIVTGGETAPLNNMPNAITTKPAPPVYRGNNGRGFDVYESTVDGMPVLMPDSANKASLNYGSVKKIPGNRVYMVPQAKNPKRP